MVPSGYFVGRSYISQQSWRELWRDCLRVDYVPVVHVKAVKPKPDQDYAHALRSALTETLKYSVKPQDLAGAASPTDPDRAWLVALTQQMKGSRSVAVGGVLRQFIVDSEPDDLIHPEGAEADSSTQPEVWFAWKTQVKRYAKA